MRLNAADDRHVIDAVGIDRADEPDATGKLGLTRIAQQLPAGAQHDRQLPGVDVKPFDQRLGETRPCGQNWQL